LTLFQSLCNSTGIVPPTSPAPSQTRLAVDPARLPWTRRLGLDYVRDFDRVAPFFAGNPALADAWRDTIDRVRAHPRDRTALAAIVSAQQQDRHAPDAARASAARLRDANTFAIVTGQQAGLFGGPIFTLLKAITAIELARRIETEHGVPVVPVFWIDSEDHDWDEVASCTVLDGELAPRSVRLAHPGEADGRPVASVRLQDSVGQAVDELAAALTRTEFTADLVEQLRRYYAPGRGMSHAFGSWLESLLGPHGLIVFDSADPAAKPLVASLFVQELREPGETAARAASAGAALEARGYTAQVAPTADAVALFHLNGTREPIKQTGGGFSVGDREIAKPQLVAEAETSPDRFSPNVLLRPIVQDTLFPTIAYVAGPSEIVYLGQLREVYGRFGVPMPLCYPRASATLVDGAALRFLSRHDVGLQELQPRDEAVLNRLLEAQLPREVEEALQQAQRETEARMQAVVDAMPAVDPTLEGAARSTLGKMRHELEALHGKVIQAAKRRDDTLRRQFIRAQAQAFPDGEPQERAVGFVWLLNRVGPALVEILRRDLPIEPGQHWVLTV
jgi:bacillithiol biosynthesis cysteine-adding enzyme BshC